MAARAFLRSINFTLGKIMTISILISMGILTAVISSSAMGGSENSIRGVRAVM
jgi:hypothetical protein